jgi:hypothetical protein
MRTEVSLLNLGEFVTRRIGNGQQKTIYLRETGEKILVTKVEQ